MSEQDTRHNGHLVDSLGSALRSGEHGLSTVPGLLKRVLIEESWRDFTTKRGEHVEHKRFGDFVTTPPLHGLGADMALVRRVVADDTEALGLLDQALQQPDGGDHRSEQYQTTVDNIHGGRPSGTSQDRALRKLRTDAPELHAEVLAGNLSAHRAMVQAGFRPKTFTVRPDRPDTTARSLRKHMNDEQWAEFLKWALAEEGGAQD